ncbi:hypothetical protein KIN20_004383 [Parelaphostrongylus tenuis]|uniref:Uncharacterized protein n=1 Tax=Parelaphostrongylus tenuis TaxID=148309 RepID=A0AAD5QJ99_PARTN|nr:hypothetical protein KIN20_004383 [Parelaphostrongylus tenuis]
MEKLERFASLILLPLLIGSISQQDVVDSDDNTTNTIALVDDVKREIINRLATSAALLTLATVDERC